MTFTLLGVGTAIIAVANNTSPLFPLAFLAIGYAIDLNRKAAKK